MIRIIKIAAAVFVLLLFTLSYLYFRTYQSYNNVIHKNACYIIKINTQEILKTALKESIFSIVTSERTVNDTVSKKDRESGLAIPANFFVYTISSKSGSTFFCSIPVNDSAKVKQFLIEKLGFKKYQQLGNNITGYSEDKRLTVVFNNQTLALSYSLNKEDVIDVLADLVAHNNCLSYSDELIKRLRKSEGHIVYHHNNEQLAVTIEENLVSFKSSAIKVPFLEIPDAIVKIEKDTTSCVNLFLAANFKGLGSKSLKIKDYQILPDSILKYYKGYLNINLRGMVQQADTVVTFEYNDNFEKVVTKNVTMNQVPEIYLTTKVNTKPLVNYLKREKWFNNAGINAEIFPLYKLKTFTKGDVLQITTANHAYNLTSNQSTTDFLSFFIDFNKLRTVFRSTRLKNYTDVLEYLKMNAHKVSNDEIEIKGEIVMRKKLSDLLF